MIGGNEFWEALGGGTLRYRLVVALLRVLYDLIAEITALPHGHEIVLLGRNFCTVTSPGAPTNLPWRYLPQAVMPHLGTAEVLVMPHLGHKVRVCDAPPRPQGQVRAGYREPHNIKLQKAG